MVETITSTTNPRIKHLRSLAANRKDRRQERLFVVEGIRLVDEALLHNAAIHSIVYDPDHLSMTAGGADLMARIDGRRDAYAATSQVLAVAADTVSPQGVLAIVQLPQPAPRRAGIRLVLDAIQDPGNVGTLLRSADAAGVSDVICLAGTADVYSPKVVRAAMGSHFRLPITQDLRWDQMQLDVDHIYATASDATVPYFAVDWRQPALIIIGNEANGVSDRSREVASLLINIPMHPGVESLNAAVAGSVILFEASRQRLQGRS
ncbi:MAG: RNA methyltransferase [Herpetosiphon sp.]